MQRKIKVKLMTLPDLWAEDKKLLKQTGIPLDINWNNALPSNDEGYRILLENTKAWENPADPIPVTREAVLSIAKEAETEIQGAWKTDFTEKPKIEVHPTMTYLMRISEIEEEVNAMFGYGIKCQSAPLSFFSPYHNIILLPENFVGRVPKREGMPLNSEGIHLNNWHIEEHPWGRPSLELISVGTFCNALFRQIRGEIGGDYVKSMKAIGPNFKENISRLNESLEILTLSKMADGNPQKGLHFVANRFMAVWANRFTRNVYFTAEALSHSKSLPAIAMADHLENDEISNAYAHFNPHHPQYERKLAYFDRK